MVRRRKTHTKKRKSRRGEKTTGTISITKTGQLVISRGGSAARRAGGYAKTKVTKENIRKAADAAKAASKRLYGILRRKKVPPRITMSLYRK